MNLIKYLKETKTELRHVSWPTRKQTINFTALVIGLSLLVAFLLGVFDMVFDIGLKEFILGTSTEAPLDIPINSSGDPFNIDNIEIAVPESPEDTNALGIPPEDITE